MLLGPRRLEDLRALWCDLSTKVHIIVPRPTNAPPRSRSSAPHHHLRIISALRTPIVSALFLVLVVQLHDVLGLSWEVCDLLRFRVLLPIIHRQLAGGWSGSYYSGDRMPDNPISFFGG